MQERTRAAGISLAVLAVLLAAPLIAEVGTVAAQTTWNVPGDAATIQGGLDLALGGDTVLVAPGTYVESIDFDGKAVTLASSGGSAVTTIEASGNSSILTLDPGVTVRGFTLTGGDVPGDGGAILAFAVGAGWTASVEACRITGNRAGGTGGGVAIYGLLGNAAVTFTDCVFDDNEAVLDGGGAFIAATGNAFIDCTFRGNRAGRYGGGLGSDHQVDLQGSRFELNVAHEGGGAYIDVFDAQFTLADCAFIGNRATAPLGDGGGLYIRMLDDALSSSPELNVLGCTFVDNSAGQDGGGAWLSGANIGGPQGPLTVSGCLVAGNTAGRDGGGLTFGPSVNTVASSTIVDNAAGGLGSGLSRVGVVRESIVWGNDLDGPTSVTYSNVQGGFRGAGNIDTDPLFIDPSAGGFCLTSASPCIDAGNPVLTDPDGSVIDMGYLPRSPWCDVGLNLGSTNGIPQLTGAGELTAGSLPSMTLTGGLPFGSAAVELGVSPLMFPFEGGTMLPSLDILVVGLPLDGTGGISIVDTWPAGMPSGFTIYLQMWVEDAAGLFGYTATNGLLANTD